jgi:hypothetical protein
MSNPHSRYFYALGFFIDKFAQTEKLLALSLWKLTDLPANKARALFSGVRTDAASSYITRLLTATSADKETRDEYQYLFTQLGHITKLRNSIIHYGTEFNQSEQYITSNRFIALTPERIEERPTSYEILKQANQDLDRINWRLSAEMNKGQGGPARSFFTDVPAWNEPWQYTPPPQASQGGKNQDTTQKR